MTHVLLLVLALVAVAVWGKGTDPDRAALHVTLPNDNPRLPDNPEQLALVRPPGTLVLEATKERHDTALVAVMPEQEAKILADAGVVGTRALVTRDGTGTHEVTRGVWQFAVRDGADPHDALRAIDGLYGDGGWRRTPGLATGLFGRDQQPTADQPQTIYRAHYVRGPYVIRIEAYGKTKAVVDREFDDLAGRQLGEWPPR